MRTFYEVVSAYFDDGRVIAFIDREIKAAEKPRNTFFKGRDRDIYRDYFNSLQDAEKFVKDARFA